MGWSEEVECRQGIDSSISGIPGMTIWFLLGGSGERVLAGVIELQEYFRAFGGMGSSVLREKAVQGGGKVL